MIIRALGELAAEDFNVTFLNAMKQSWRYTKSFQCIGTPKKQDLLLYVNGYTITYTDKKGNSFTAKSGDIVYAPTGSEYRIRISDDEHKDAFTVGINFYIYSPGGEQIILSDGICIFSSGTDGGIQALFCRSVSYDMLQPPVKKKILLMEILTRLASYTLRRDIPDRIADVLVYLAENIEENPTVSQLADMCYVSEVYFRRQFKRYTGMTPREYRNRQRLEKARAYLEYGDISVQEISDMLGYSTVSHFIKEFRSCYGSSPLQYRKQFCGD